MKKTHCPIIRAIRLLGLLAACMPVLSPAADGIWTDVTAGPNNWGNSAMWSGGTIADGGGFTANFTSNITATSSIYLDSSRNIGNLIFSDNGVSGSAWVLSSSNGSVLTLGDGETAGASTINTLTTATISLTLAGANSLTKTGSSTNLYLTGANTYTGGTFINSFALGINADAALGAVPVTFVVNNLTFNAGTLSNYNGSAYTDVTLHANRGLTLTGNATFVSGGTRTLAINGVITGTGNVNTSTGGIIILAGLNTYNGKTTIGSGTTLIIHSLNNVGDTTGSSLGNVATVAAGTIELGTSLSTNTSTLLYTGTGSTSDRVLNLGNTTQGASLDQSGTGLLKFTSNVTATGAGSKTLTLQGSTAGIGEMAGSVGNNSGTNITSLAKTGSGTWILSGINSYTGTTTVNAGVLRLDSAGALSGGVATTGGISALLFNGSGLDGGVIGLTAATGDFTRSIGTGVSQVSWASGGTGGFAAFGGDRSVNFGGAAAQVTWTNTTGVFNNGLVLGHSSADSTVTVVNPIGLNSTGSRTVIVNDGSAAVDAILSGVLSQSQSALIKSGAGTLALTANNTFGSARTAGTTFTTINAGTLQLGNGGTTGSLTSTGTGDIQNDGTLAVNRSNEVMLQYIIKGTGTLRQTGPGTTTLSAFNTYSGTTAVLAGGLVIASTGSTGTGAVTVQSGGMILGSGIVQGSGFTAESGATVQAGETTATNSFGTLTFTPASGTGSFDFQSGSSVILGINPGGTGDLLNFDGLSNGSLLFNGNLQVTAAGYTPISAETFNLLDWSNLSTTSFHGRYDSASYPGGLLRGNGDDNLGFDLPDISNSDYAWDISSFVSNGSISTVLIIPEPNRYLLLLGGALGIFMRRRRQGVKPPLVTP